MASRVAAKTVTKAVKSAKPKAPAAAKPKAAATTATEAKPKTLLIKEGAGFKEATARQIANSSQGKLSLTTVNDVQNHVFAALRTSLAKTGRVSVPGLGVFKVGVRPARTGRNPKTGDALQIEKKNSIRFSATPTWKAEVQSFVVPPKVKKAPKAAK